MARCTSQRSGYRCCSCDRPFHADTPVQCEIRVYVKFISSLRCPHCRGQNLTLGLNLTPTENDALRITGSEAERAANWLQNGETGLSSLTIYHHLTGQEVPAPAVPTDADDLKRCIYLLKHVPEWADRLTELAVLTPQWAALTTAWPQLVNTFERDAASPGKGYARTNSLLRELLSNAHT